MIAAMSDPEDKDAPHGQAYADFVKANERRRKARSLLALGPVVLAIAATVASFALTFATGPETLASTSERLQATTTALQEKQARQAAEVSALRAAQEQLAKDLRNADPTLAAGSSIANSLAALTDRLDALDKVILEKPAKTLEVHLLRSEVEKVRADYQNAELRAAKDIERVYDLAKWLFGVVVVTIIGMVFKAFFDGRPKPPEAAAAKPAP
jgi:hypothetical protein